MIALDAFLASAPAALAGLVFLHFLWQGLAIAGLLLLAQRPLARRSANARYLASALAMAAMALAPVVTAWTLAGNAQLPTGTLSLSVGPEPVRGLEAFVPALALFWLLGSCVEQLRLVLSWWRARGLRARETGPLASRWDERLARLIADLGVTPRVRVLESARATVPTVIGWLKPVVLVPTAALTRLTPAQLEVVLAHELAHVRRHDYLVNLVQSVIEAVLFFHPAVHWVSRRMRVEREYCCDDLAVGVRRDPLTYARALERLESLRSDAGRLALASTGGNLMHRIQRLIQPAPTPARRGLALGALPLTLLAGGLLTASAFGWSASDPGPEPPAEPIAGVQEDDAADELERRVDRLKREIAELEAKIDQLRSRRNEVRFGPRDDAHGRHERHAERDRERHGSHGRHADPHGNEETRGRFHFRPDFDFEFDHDFDFDFDFGEDGEFEFDARELHRRIRENVERRVREHVPDHGSPERDARLPRWRDHGPDRAHRERGHAHGEHDGHPSPRDLRRPRERQRDHDVRWAPEPRGEFHWRGDDDGPHERRAWLDAWSSHENDFRFGDLDAEKLHRDILRSVERTLEEHAVDMEEVHEHVRHALEQAGLHGENDHGAPHDLGRTIHEAIRGAVEAANAAEIHEHIRKAMEQVDGEALHRHVREALREHEERNESDARAPEPRRRHAAHEPSAPLAPRVAAPWTAPSAPEPVAPPTPGDDPTLTMPDVPELPDFDALFEQLAAIPEVEPVAAPDVQQTLELLEALLEPPSPVTPESPPIPSGLEELLEGLEPLLEAVETEAEPLQDA